MSEAGSAARPADDVVEFRHDDEGYLRWLQDHPHGYVVNTTPQYSRGYRKLHRASCNLVNNLMSVYTTWTGGQYIKVCADRRAALEAWSERNGGVALGDRCSCSP